MATARRGEANICLATHGAATVMAAANHNCFCHIHEVQDYGYESC